MKEIKAVIRPSKLTTLRDALHAIAGFPGMTVSKAEGCSGSGRLATRFTIKEALTDFTPKVRVEIVVADELAQEVFECIKDVAQTGQIGDGIVWMTEVERAAFIFKTTAGGVP